MFLSPLNSEQVSENDQLGFVKIMALSGKSSGDIKDILQKALGSKALKKTKIDAELKLLKKEETPHNPSESIPTRGRLTRADSKKAKVKEDEPPKSETKATRAKAPAKQTRLPRAKKVVIASPPVSDENNEEEPMEEEEPPVSPKPEPIKNTRGRRRPAPEPEPEPEREPETAAENVNNGPSKAKKAKSQPKVKKVPTLPPPTTRVTRNRKPVITEDLIEEKATSGSRATESNLKALSKAAAKAPAKSKSATKIVADTIPKPPEKPVVDEPVEVVVEPPKEPAIIEVAESKQPEPAVESKEENNLELIEEKPAKRPRANSRTRKPAAAAVTKNSRNKKITVDDQKEKEDDVKSKLDPKILEPEIVPEKRKKSAECLAGKVYVFGEDLSGELGQSKTSFVKQKPCHVPGIADPVVSIAAGAMHTLCVTDKGEVYSWGCNDELALGRETSPDADPPLEAQATLVPLPEKIAKISAGDSHSAALSDTGAVYCWGNFKDSNGSIGLTTQIDKACVKSVKIDVEDKIIDIASGSDHMLLLNDKGHILSLGVGEQGRLGRLDQSDFKFKKEKRELYFKPQPVKFDEDIVCDRIWAGNWSCFARSKTGQIYAWGLNNYSQLGFKSILNHPDLPLTDVCVPLPKLISAFSSIDASIEKISCGQYHTLVLDKNGKVYSFGRGDYGRLGLGEDVNEQHEPKQIPTLKDDIITEISANMAASFAINDQGHLFSWGMNATMLGMGNREDDLWIPTRVTSKHLDKSRAILVSAGSQHTVIVIKDTDQE